MIPADDYADERYYTSTWGRFLTPDPYVATDGLKNPQSWNRYGYVGDDPVNYNDPSGLLMRAPEGPPQMSCIINGWPWPDIMCQLILGSIGGGVGAPMLPGPDGRGGGGGEGPGPDKTSCPPAPLHPDATDIKANSQEAERRARMPMASWVVAIMSPPWGQRWLQCSG